MLNSDISQIVLICKPLILFNKVTLKTMLCYLQENAHKKSIRICSGFFICEKNLEGYFNLKDGV